MEALLMDYQNQLIDEYTGKSDDYVKEHAVSRLLSGSFYFSF